MKTAITTLVALAVFAGIADGQVLHTDFTEASLGDITWLNKDAPGAPERDFDLNTTADTLDFTHLNGFNADMWGTRNYAPIAWAAAPTVANGQTWSVETYVAAEKDGANNQEVTGITFYGGPDGANPNFTFGLDDWNGWSANLQGLGDNNPRVNGADLGSAPGVFLRVEVTEGGATDTYNFFYKANEVDAWTQLGGVATNFMSNFANSRVGLFLKNDTTGGGAAQFDYLTITGACNPGDTDNDGDIDTGDLTTSIQNFTGAGGSTTKTCAEGDTDEDGDVDTGDLTFSIQNFTGAQAGNAGVPDLVYDPATGNVTIDADGADVISFSLQSGPFNAADFSELPAGLTDNIASQIGWTSFNLFSGLTGTADLGAILPAGLDAAQLEAALTTASYGLALASGGGGGTFEIIIPEPTSSLLLCLGAFAFARRSRC